jgi:hypothetical protein
MGDYVKEEVDRIRKSRNNTEGIAQQADAGGQDLEADGHADRANDKEGRVEPNSEAKEASTAQERVDISGSSLPSILTYSVGRYHRRKKRRRNGLRTRKRSERLAIT